MSSHLRAFCPMICALLWQAPAAAQDFYVGALYEAGEGVFAGSASGSDPAGFVGIAGLRVPMSPTFYIAGEAEVRFWDEATGAREFSQTLETQRYRAIVGADLPNLSVFLGTTTPERSTWGDGNDDALALSVGVNVPVNQGLTIRLEASSDKLFTREEATPASGVVRLGTFINF